MTIAENILLEKLAISDMVAYREIFHDNYPVLYKRAYYFLGDSKVAEDVVQDVFLMVWSIRTRLVIHTSLKAFLLKCVYNRCIRQKNKNKPFENLKSITSLIENPIERTASSENGLSYTFINEMETIINKTIDAFPSKTQSIFRMSRDQNISNKNIATHFYISEKAVEYHITKALGLIRFHLKDYLK